jgi:hypothetical protein
LACELFIAQHSGLNHLHAMKVWWSGLSAMSQQEWMRRAIQSMHGLAEAWTHGVQRQLRSEERTPTEQRQILREYIYQLAMERACLEHVVNLIDSQELCAEVRALDRELDEYYDQIEAFPPIEHGAAFLFNTIALPPSGVAVDAWWSRLLLDHDGMLEFDQ